MTPAEFDFRKPPPGDLERNVESWLTFACRRATEEASHALHYPAAFQLVGVQSPPAAASLALLPEGAIGVLLAPPDREGNGAALLAVPNPLLLALFAGLVSQTPAALPAEREPTPLELSLLPHLVNTLINAPLEKSWPGGDAPVLSVGPPVTPTAAWSSGAERVLLATLTVSAPFGDHPLYLLFTRSGRWEALATAGARPAPVVPVPREEIEAIVRAMGVEVTVVLGKADMTMHDLSGLAAGDVVVFDQKVTQPLDGLVAGARKFRAWPGAVGDRAAVVIDTITGD